MPVESLGIAVPTPPSDGMEHGDGEADELHAGEVSPPTPGTPYLFSGRVVKPSADMDSSLRGGRSGSPAYEIPDPEPGVSAPPADDDGEGNRKLRIEVPPAGESLRESLREEVKEPLEVPGTPYGMFGARRDLKGATPEKFHADKRDQEAAAGAALARAQNG